MKTSLITVLFCSISIQLFSQKESFVFTESKTPTIRRADLKDVTFLNDLMPKLWDNLNMPYQESVELSLIRNYFPEKDYTSVFNIISVEVNVVSEGQNFKMTTSNLYLEKAQVAKLSRADIGSDITVRLFFNHKRNTLDEGTKDVRVAYYSVKVLPEVEASFPGGKEALNAYLSENIINRFSKKGDDSSLPLSFVKFVINEKGAIKNVELNWVNDIPDWGDQLLKVFEAMPNWIPAQNVNGINVEQQIIIPFWNYDC